MWWGRRRAGRVQDAATPSTPSVMGLMLAEARAGETSQLQIASSLDQRGGVLLGFAGLLVTVIVGQGLGWWGVAAAVLAGLAAVLAARSLMTWPVDRVDPRELLDTYAEATHAEVVAVLAQTSATAYDSRASALHSKRRPLAAAVVLLLASVAVLIAGVTLGVAQGQNDDAPTATTTGEGGDDGD